MKPRSDVVVRARFDHEASRVMQLPDGPARSQAAGEWCDAHGPSVSMMALDVALDLRSVRRHAAHVGDVIAIAASGHQLLREILRGVEEDAAAAGRAASTDALLPVLVLWPVRANGELYCGSLVEWAQKRIAMEGPCRSAARIAAFFLRRWPELSYAIADVLRSIEVRRHTCGLSYEGTCAETVQTRVVLTRILEGRESHQLDAVALQSARIETVLGDDGARSAACKLAAKGRLPPALVQAAVAAMTEAPPWLRARALRLLLASKGHQEEAVRMMASSYGTGHPVNILWGTDNALDAACTGDGWGRKAVREKLLPLTDAIWRRENQLRWHPLWRLLATDDDAGAWERVRECVAELLLKRVLSTASAPAVRTAALEALDVLHPGGDGSFAKALGKIDRESELGRRASEVQRRWKKQTSIADGELAVEESWNAYWKTIDARETA